MNMIARRENRELGCQVYEPTSKDIRQACEEIQATWSPRERAKRERGPRAARWIPPMIRLAFLIEAIHGKRADTPPCAGTAGNKAEH